MLRIFRKGFSTYTDDELIELYQQKEDMEAIGALFERYTELIFGVCLKILQNEAEAEDAFMGVFEKVSDKLRVHHVQQFRPWLHTLVRNYCIEIIRKKKRNLTVSYDAAFMQSSEELHPFNEEADMQNDEQLTQCLERLNMEQKSCIQLFYFEGKSYKAIAQIKGENIGKIRSFIQNGRRNLKICLEEKGVKHIN